MKKIQLHAFPLFLLVFPVVFLFVTSFFFAIANAEEVTLAWNANSEEDLAGYKLYYDGDSDTEIYRGVGATEGDSPIIIYKDELENPDSPSFTVSGLTTGEYYYFALTAFNTDGIESDFSDEVGVEAGTDFAVSATSNNSADSSSSESSDDGGGGGCFISGAMASHNAGTAIAGVVLVFVMAVAAARRRETM